MPDSLPRFVAWDSQLGSTDANLQELPALLGGAMDVVELGAWGGPKPGSLQRKQEGEIEGVDALLCFVGAPNANAARERGLRSPGASLWHWRRQEPNAPPGSSGCRFGACWPRRGRRGSLHWRSWPRRARGGTLVHSTAYQAALRQAAMVPSMSRKGNCWDNTVSESFFGTLKQELLPERLWADLQAAKNAISSYIHHCYNPIRRHSTFDRFSPFEFEYHHQRAA